MKQLLYIKDFKIVLTCLACPEQYDVFKQGRMVAYLRLRHGYFSVQCPDVCCKTVYEAEPEGDGMFNQNERMKYLTEAIMAIKKYRKYQQSRRAKHGTETTKYY